MNRLAQWLLGKPRSTQGDTLAALDIGTSKIACFIARLDEEGQPHVVGIGHQLSEGVRAGLVSDMEVLRGAVSSAVDAAEQMAGEEIERVIVNIAGAQLLSQTVNVDLPLNGREITAHDMERLVAEAQTMAAEDMDGHTLELLHTLPIHYTLDGQRGIREPLGMIGGMLQADYHLVSAAFGPARTLETAIARAHLEVEHLVAAPLASGLSCLALDEMDLGCTVIDMGAGTTSLGIFFDGHMIHADGLALGGLHISNDIARGLTTTFAHAERLKTLYGNATLSGLDERETIDVPQVGEEDPAFANRLPKSHLIGIIQPRLEEIFEMVRARLDKSGLSETAGKRVVLTGGTSQMPGIRDLASRILDKQVRLGRPLRITPPTMSQARMQPRSLSATGLAEATSGPAFSTTAGLLVTALAPEGIDAPGRYDGAGSSLMGRLSQMFSVRG
ncbi:MAG: cell division protein FtsA [Alphaproteobacteria bacterium]|nr:cell division protein FtsA [Alphaproteobacteria bacterium]